MTTTPADRSAQGAERFRRWYDDVLRFVERRVHPSHVEDIVADAYLVAGRRLEDLPGDHGKSRAWLFGSPDRTQPSPQGPGCATLASWTTRGLLGNSRPTRAPGGGARPARSPQNTEAWPTGGCPARPASPTTMCATKCVPAAGRCWASTRYSWVTSTRWGAPRAAVLHPGRRAPGGRCGNLAAARRSTALRHCSPRD